MNELIDKTQAKLDNAIEERSIGAGWKVFRTSVLKDINDKEIISTAKVSYYGGAIFSKALVLNIARNNPRNNPEVAAELLDKIDTEVLLFMMEQMKDDFKEVHGI